MRFATLVAVLATALSSTACAKERTMEAGPKVSRDFAVANFTRVEAGGAYSVDIRTGANPSVRATGPKNVLDHMNVEVDGDTLKIHPDKKFNNVRWHGTDKVSIAITVPAIRGAVVAGAGDMKVDKSSGDKFEGIIAGSGSMDLGQLAVNALEVKIAGNGDITGRGRADRLNVDIAGAGNVAAGAIAAKQANIKIAGSGDIAANVTDTAAIRILGSGDVAITGGAKCSVKKMGGGNVKCS